MRKKPWDFIERAVLGAGEDDREQDGPRMLVVSGIGGCGKTQIIVEFLRVHARK
jgi:predicted ATPase